MVVLGGFIPTSALEVAEADGLVSFLVRSNALHHPDEGWFTDILVEWWQVKQGV